MSDCVNHCVVHFLSFLFQQNLDVPLHRTTCRTDSVSSCGSYYSPTCDGSSVMGSCLDILEEEEQEITNKEEENQDQEVSSSLHEMAEEEDDHSTETNSKMQTARLKPLVRSNGLQRDNSTKEADPSGRIFRQVLPLQNLLKKSGVVPLNSCSNAAKRR